MGCLDLSVRVCMCVCMHLCEKCVHAPDYVNAPRVSVWEVYSWYICE